ncbi:hypothetical protein ZIOFF_061115 [Zingiber officinale]|uniref:Uncharacterized protein n=1 Tax=Zingiber officinale TaxID=94328 RepID=A0A8J5FDK0_ZINOF|nr:hypothetical protein ZIOFF_061115 [Zingiber officinale]
MEPLLASGLHARTRSLEVVLPAAGGYGSPSIWLLRILAKKMYSARAPHNRFGQTLVGAAIGAAVDDRRPSLPSAVSSPSSTCCDDTRSEGSSRGLSSQRYCSSISSNSVFLGMMRCSVDTQGKGFLEGIPLGVAALLLIPSSLSVATTLHPMPPDCSYCRRTTDLHPFNLPADVAAATHLPPALCHREVTTTTYLCMPSPRALTPLLCPHYVPSNSRSTSFLTGGDVRQIVPEALWPRARLLGCHGIIASAPPCLVAWLVSSAEIDLVCPWAQSVEERATRAVHARAHCVRRWHIASVVEDAVCAIGVPPVGTRVHKALASGLPIRPVLKHGPRSLTCVRVGEFGNFDGTRKLIDGSPSLRGCITGRPRSSMIGKGSRQDGSVASGKGLALRVGHEGPDPKLVGCRWIARAALAARVGRRVLAGGRIGIGSSSGGPSSGVKQLIQNCALNVKVKKFN